MIAEAALARLPELAAAFQRRAPFRHVVIDDFLEADVAARLLADFPPFDAARARNENGDIGGKAAHEKSARDAAKHSEQSGDRAVTRRT